MRKGFDNDKYLAMQSEHIRERIHSLTINCIWNSVENCMTITMHPAYFQDLNRTANCGC